MTLLNSHERFDLFFDLRDEVLCRRQGRGMIPWLADLGARPLQEAKEDDSGFLFAGARSIEDYRELVSSYPNIRDRPEERGPLLRLDDVLDAIERAGINIPRPRSWYLDLDEAPPENLCFPLFVRTPISSWKLGGSISCVQNLAELEAESFELRHAFGWNERIIAREWLDLEPAGEFMWGMLPQEVRVWIVDGTPYAWSFHHGHAVARPRGFPPSKDDLRTLCQRAAAIATAFSSKLVCADFARTITGEWYFLEAGPGSSSGTAHEGVFKSVAAKIMGRNAEIQQDETGGLFDL